jgi:hypothetical protein
VRPGIVNRLDDVAGSQGDVACDMLGLDGLRGLASDAVEVFRTFQIESFRLAQIDPGENASPVLRPIATGIVHERPMLFGSAHTQEDVASTILLQLRQQISRSHSVAVRQCRNLPAAISMNKRLLVPVAHPKGAIPLSASTGHQIA